MREHHVEHIYFKCSVCADEFEEKYELEKHSKNQHGSKEGESCQKSANEIKHTNLTEKHNQKQHQTRKCINCNQCEFSSVDPQTFITHTLNEHGCNSDIIQCPHCDFKSIDIRTMDSHIENDHVELALSGHISSNQTTLTQKFGTFKNELTTALNRIIEGHNEMKHEFFTLRQKDRESNIRMENMENTIRELKNLLCEKRLSETSSRIEAPKVQQPKTPSVILAAAVPIRKKTRYLEKPKVLYVGDSIAQNVSMRKIEKETNTRVKTVKAYSAVEDLKARYPSKNFTDVTPAALKDTGIDDKFTELVLATPSVDISNMNTENLTENDNIEVFQQKVIISCQNMFFCGSECSS